MYHVQVPSATEAGETVLEFFSSLEEAEEYAEGLLLYSLPDKAGFPIYQGTTYVSAVVRLHVSGEIFTFREYDYDEDAVWETLCGAPWESDQEYADIPF